MREKHIRKEFAENHLDIVLVNFTVLITKTCKLGTILSKWLSLNSASNQNKVPVMIYAIYQYVIRKVTFMVLDLYLFWHLQISVTQFADFTDSVYRANILINNEI